VLTQNIQKEGDNEEAAARETRTAVPWRRTERRGRVSAQKQKKKEEDIRIFDDAVLD